LSSDGGTRPEEDPAGTLDPEQEPGTRPRPAVLVAVALGGALGTWLRAVLTVSHSITAVPWAVLAVNVVGSALLGLGMESVPRWRPDWTSFRPFFAAGLCGGLTTFSTLTVGVDLLAYRSRVGPAAVYLGTSLVLGLAAAAAGLGLGRWVAGPGR
jgi:fluoride exporter